MVGDPGFADPNDRWVFNEFDEDIPRLIDNKPVTEAGILSRLADVFSGLKASENQGKPVEIIPNEARMMNSSNDEIEALKGDLRKAIDEVNALKAQFTATNQTRTVSRTPRKRRGAPKKEVEKTSSE